MMSDKKAITKLNTKMTKNKKSLRGKKNKLPNSSNIRNSKKLKKSNADSNTTGDVNFSENKIQMLLNSLHEQCSLSGYHLQSCEVPGAVELSQIATRTIHSLKAKEEETNEEKKELREEQVKMLEKLIDLLKEVSSMSNIDNDENNGNTVLQQSSPTTKETPDQRKNSQKNNFIGFRYPKPIYRDSIGRYTAERLFQPSPPPSPTPPEDSETSGNIQDLSELDFVFKPTAETLKELNHQRLILQKRVSDEEEALNHSVGKHRKKPKNIGIQKEKKDSQEVTMNHVMKTTKKKGRPRKSVNRVWASNLTRKKQRKGSYFMKNYQVRREESRGEERRRYHRTNSALPISNKQTKRRRRLSVSSVRRLRKKSEPSRSSDSRSPDHASRISLRSSPEKSSQMSSRTPKKATSHSEDNRTKREIFLAKRAAKARLARKLKRMQTPKVPRKPHYRVARYYDLTQNNGNLCPPASILLNRSDEVLNNHQINADGTSNQNENNQINHSIYTPSVSRRHLRGSEFPRLFYPVHPYTSPDLPVHFIPIDSKNIPDFFPLYYPTVGMKNTTEIYPAFVQLRSTDGPLFPRHIFTNALQSSSIPHQSLPAEEVLPRIIPGIASTSECPLAPNVTPYKSGSTKTLINAVNSLSNSKSTSSTAVNGILKTHNNLAKNVQGLPKPSIALIKRYVDDPKIHKCSVCGYETPKLGILKRHQVVHSKNNMSSISAESSIVETQVENQCDSTPSVQSSMPINTSPRPLTKLPSPSDGTRIKIVSAESLKGAVELQNTFHGFPEKAVCVPLDKRLPSVTITPLIHHPYD